MKTGLTKYIRQYPTVCKLTDDETEIGCNEFEIKKRLLFLTDCPICEERKSISKSIRKYNKSSISTMKKC